MFVTLLRLMPPTHFPIPTGQNNVKLYLMLTHLPIMIDQKQVKLTTQEQHSENATNTATCTS